MGIFSFSARRKSVESQRYIRRLIDLTVPNKGSSAGAERFENRHNRTIPVLVCPWEHGSAMVEQARIVVTKDLADQGVGVLFKDPIDTTEVVLGFCLAEATAGEPWFFAGSVEHKVAIGGGFWLVGIGLHEFMNDSRKSQLAGLVPLALSLLPPASHEARS